jgi:hypothetical protein
MKRFVSFAIGFLAVAMVQADSPTDVGTSRPVDPQAVLRKNPFKLRPESSSPPSAAVPAPSASDLKLSGLDACGTKRSAYFILEQSGQTPRYFRLAEGEAQGDVMVVAIDIASETVRLRRNGADLTLSLKADGVKSEDLLRHEEKTFVIEHARAHEAHQQREQRRLERERALAEAEIKAREQSVQATLRAHGFVSGDVNEQSEAQAQSNARNP